MERLCKLILMVGLFGLLAKMSMAYPDPPPQWADACWFVTDDGANVIEDGGTTWDVVVTVEWSTSSWGWVKPEIWNPTAGEFGEWVPMKDSFGGESIYCDGTGDSGTRVFTYKVLKNSTWGGDLYTGELHGVCRVRWEHFTPQQTNIVTGDQIDVYFPDE